MPATKTPLTSLLQPGGIGQQLLVWGILQELLGGAVEPIAQEIRQAVYPLLPSVPIPPAMAAELVLKHWWDLPRGKVEAKKSGIDEPLFEEMVNNTGEPLAIEELLQAFRRDVLSWDEKKGALPSTMDGIRQSRLRDEWAPVLKELQWIPIPVGDLADAVVENQIDRELADKVASWNGVKKEDFAVLVNTRGRPPSPMELITLYRRGLIPLEGTGPTTLSVQQGIAEGATKDKWWRHVADLSTYVPPPRTVSALLRSGVIDAPTAKTYYADAGLDEKLTAYYTAGASSQKVAKHKELAEGQILDLYEAQTLTQAEVTPLLAALGYEQQEIDWILSLRDVQRSVKVVNSAISRIGNNFIARKLTAAQASLDLDALGVAPAQRDHLIGTWQLERGATVRTLTQAEITAAFGIGLMDAPTAQGYLEALGYSPYDAWVLLSIKAKGPVSDMPAEGVTIPASAV